MTKKNQRGEFFRFSYGTRGSENKSFKGADPWSYAPPSFIDPFLKLGVPDLDVNRIDPGQRYVRSNINTQPLKIEKNDPSMKPTQTFNRHTLTFKRLHSHITPLCSTQKSSDPAQARTRDDWNCPYRYKQNIPANAPPPLRNQYLKTYTHSQQDISAFKEPSDIQQAPKIPAISDVMKNPESSNVAPVNQIQLQFIETINLVEHIAR